MAELWFLADVGGTNTRVGVAQPDGMISKSIRRLENASFDSLGSLLTHYLKSTDTSGVNTLCAGVAGPVRNEAAKLTNYDWTIRSSDLKNATGAANVHLMNDLQAQGYALDDLDPTRVSSLFAGSNAPDDASRLVIGLGTGSNVAVVHRVGRSLFVPPAESGHASLPYASGKLRDLIAHLSELQAHRPMESALSGPGLSQIYAWLTGTAHPPEDIVAAYHAGDEGAVETLMLFCELFGQVLGDLALAHLPMGGIYLIGGTARSVAPILADTQFHETFCAKGPYSPIMRDIPMLLIEDDNAALFGCLRFLQQCNWE